jgi:arylsulfatase
MITASRLTSLLVGLLAGASATAVERPLNIVLLYADDLRSDVLGAYGNPLIRTPHLDRLARDGVRFANNCVTTSCCGPSRATLFTGQWMSRHGCPAFDAFTTPWPETFVGILRGAEYVVGHVGKWHNGRFPPRAFDFGRVYPQVHWIRQPDGSKTHATRLIERDALDFIKDRTADRPFHLTVAFNTPHAEDQAPQQYQPQPASMAWYQDVTIPPPPNMDEAAWKRLPPFFDERNEGRSRFRKRFATPEQYQAMMRNYYRLITEVDAACGRILDELERRGLAERTLVVFTSDNGYFHGEHGLADKWYPHQESIRVPLIIRDPRMPAAKRGTTDDACTLNVDLAPTFLAAAGLPPAPRMQGRDLAPLYLSATRPDWRSDFFYEHATIKNADFIPASQALVRRDWKYLWWPEQRYEQLFDLTADPREERDLAREPAYAARLAELRTRFQHLREAAR